MVVIVHVTQQPPAEATIFWDNAFAETVSSKYLDVVQLQDQGLCNEESVCLYSRRPTLGGTKANEPEVALIPVILPSRSIFGCSQNLMCNLCIGILHTRGHNTIVMATGTTTASCHDNHWTKFWIYIGVNVK